MPKFVFSFSCNFSTFQAIGQRHGTCMSDAASPLRLILIDDDAEFTSYFLSYASPYNLIIDVCFSKEEGLKKINQTKYDVYLVDLNLPDGSGLDIVKEIRNREKSNITIALISSLYSHKETYQALKNKFDLDYVLDKPIYPQQINWFLTNLTEKGKKTTAYKSNDTLEGVIKNYIKGVGEKLTLLSDLIHKAQNDPSPDSLLAFANAIHKIAGSAGTYGFPEVSKLCKTLEFNIKDRVDKNSYTDKSFLDSFNQFFKDVRYHFQIPANQNGNVAAEPVALQRPSLYILDEDTFFLDLIQREKSEFNLNIVVESNPENAYRQFKLGQVQPRLVVLPQKFLGAEIDAFDMIDLILKKQSNHPPIFALMLEKDDLVTRVAAIDKGVKFFFHKPISANTLLRSFASILDVGLLSDFKVLILDDDPEFCQYASVVLSKIGMKACIINEPQPLYKTLAIYKPDLLLLDIRLPDYDGFELLKTIRADITYRNLLIIIVTASEDANTSLLASSSTADAVLYKPINQSTLQSCALNLVRRNVGPQLREDRSSLGLYTEKHLIKKLDELLSSPPEIPRFLTLLTLDRYDELCLSPGIPAVNDCLVMISNELQRNETHQITTYYCNAATFALVFNNFEKEAVENRLFQILNPISSRSDITINFICNIVPIQSDLGCATDLIKLAKQGLKGSAKIEYAAVRIHSINSHATNHAKKIVMMIDPNEDLAVIMKTALESKGLVVKIFKEGEPAMKELLQQQTLPSLLIVERCLPDMDGIEILKKARNQIKTAIPFYFLTDFASEKDVLEGLKYGANEYITKPFNLNFFVEMVLKAVQSR